jgi:hypothetical protein
MKATYSVIGNIRINDELRLGRLRLWIRFAKSLQPENWIFKIRGKCKESAEQLLKQELGDKLLIHKDARDESWVDSTLLLLEKNKSEVVINVVEDHLMVGNREILENIVAEMIEHKIDTVHYSWYSEEKLTLLMEGIHCFETDFLQVYEIDHEVNAQRIKNYTKFKNYRQGPHLVSLAGIFESKFYKKVLESYDVKLRKFGTDEPFDFEKTAADIDLLPLRCADPKIEIFACLDDDNLFPNSSLQSRKLLTAEPKRAAVASNHNWVYRDIAINATNYINASSEMLGEFIIREYAYDEQYRELKSGDFSVMSSTLIGLSAFNKSFPHGAYIEIMDLKNVVINSLIPLFFERSKLGFLSKSKYATLRFIEACILNGCYERTFTDLFDQASAKINDEKFLTNNEPNVLIIASLSSNSSCKNIYDRLRNWIEVGKSPWLLAMHQADFNWDLSTFSRVGISLHKIQSNEFENLQYANSVYGPVKFALFRAQEL